MPDIVYYNRNKGRVKINRIVLFIFIFLLAASFFPEGYIVANTQHQCIVSSCQIYEYVKNLKILDILMNKIIAIAFIALILSFILFSVTEFSSRNNIFAVQFETLIYKKIRMND